ncbi:MAG: GTP-binding protein, partial [Candidatus Marinimicrobia bacterium]|nr:GTP-binding protein [Candidatus Neomarinimicrobiota bacterium]
MKEFQTKDIRNISLLGHASSGKTTLVEAILYNKGEIDRFGKIDEGNTISDYHADEKERKHSINYSLMHTVHKDKKVNIIDNPGYLDFIASSKSAIRVTDMGLITINAKNGVETGTELSFRFTKPDQLPVGFIINKLRSEDSNFDETLSQLKDSFGKNSVVPIQLPVKEGKEFNKVVDIINMVCYEYSDDKSGKAKKVDIPEAVKAQAEEIRTGLIESIAETDEELLEKFFELETLPEEDIVSGLKEAIKNREVFPVFATDALNNIGVSNLLDHLISFVPAPDERELPATKEDVEIEASDDAPTSCFIFQTMMEGHAGGLFFIKVMSGVLEKGMTLLNT